MLLPNGAHTFSENNVTFARQLLLVRTEFMYAGSIKKSSTSIRFPRTLIYRQFPFFWSVTCKSYDLLVYSFGN